MKLGFVCASCRRALPDDTSAGVGDVFINDLLVVTPPPAGLVPNEAQGCTIYTAYDQPDLRPRDMIDLQSFIWVMGSDEYDE